MAQVIKRIFVPTTDICQMLWPVLALTGEFEISHMKMAVETEHMQLWAVENGAGIKAVALTEVVVYPSLQAIRVVALAGHGMKEWQFDLIQRIVQFGRQYNCTRLEAVCRPGLERVLAPMGFEKKLVCLTKEIQDESTRSRLN